ncbi:MAG: porin [Gracilimonas sp.]|nr:porin [Gracilimonas sp.]
MNFSNTLKTLLGISLLLLMSLSMQMKMVKAQGINFETDEGWSFSVTGQLPVFLVASNHENYSSNGEDQVATRVMSGFNPGGINFNISAPEMNGITVKGVFQINHHLQGPSVQNAGLFEGRVADIQVAGDFGTIYIGKNLGIFNSSSIADAGSGLGVGRFGGPDAANATLGRIGTGYTYANFNPRIMYATPDMNGISVKAGLINPEKPSGPAQSTIETTLPRFEAQTNYILNLENGAIDFWVGGMLQNVNVISVDYDYNISGWDLGARLNASGFGLTGAYSQTKGVGADGLIGLNLTGTGISQADVDAQQWYTEATYDIDRLTLGVSYGEGSQDAKQTVLGSSPEIKNTLTMLFTRYELTNNLNLLGELQNFTSDAQSDYQAVVAGMQLNF